jgi:hypothetical protein
MTVKQNWGIDVFAEGWRIWGINDVNGYEVLMTLTEMMYFW